MRFYWTLWRLTNAIKSTPLRGFFILSEYNNVTRNEYLPFGKSWLFIGTTSAQGTVYHAGILCLNGAGFQAGSTVSPARPFEYINVRCLSETGLHIFGKIKSKISLDGWGLRRDENIITSWNVIFPIRKWKRINLLSKRPGDYDFLIFFSR